jgi:hypothetical protein
VMTQLVKQRGEGLSGQRVSPAWRRRNQRRHGRS